MRLRDQLLRFSRFLGLSAVSAGITIALPMLLHYALGIEQRAAVAVSLVLAFVVNFLGLHHLVFGSRGGYAGQVVRFGLASLVSRALEYGAFNALLALGAPFPVAVVATQGVFTVLKYWLYGRIVFTQPGSDQTPPDTSAKVP